MKIIALRRRKQVQFKWAITQRQSISICEKDQDVTKYQNLIVNQKSKAMAKPVNFLGLLGEMLYLWHNRQFSYLSFEADDILTGIPHLLLGTKIIILKVSNNNKNYFPSGQLGKKKQRALRVHEN